MHNRETAQNGDGDGISGFIAYGFLFFSSSSSFFFFFLLISNLNFNHGAC